MLSELDQYFLAAFQNCAIPAADFRHREHLRVAYVYLTLHPLEIAIQKTEAGLQRLLTHVGAPPEKYHRTLTVAWLRAVHHFMVKTPATADFAQFIQTNGAPLLDLQILNTHYSPACLWSTEARTHFLEPDLQAFPAEIK